MMTNNVLTQALIQNLDNEISGYKQKMNDMPDYVFSKRYEQRKNKVLKAGGGGSNHSSRATALLRRHSRRRVIVLVAVIIIIMTVSSTIAVVKPDVFYIIKEKITNWNITFDDLTDEKGFDFDYLAPPVPNDYKLISETKGRDYYYIDYENASGQTIGYAQMLPGNAAISVDSEQATPIHKTINGFDAITYEKDGAMTIVFDNSAYVFVIDGTCEKDILLDLVEKMTVMQGQ